MLRHGVRAAKSEIVGDFLVSRRRPLRPLPFLDEINNLLLFSRQGHNTVCQYSITCRGVNCSRRGVFTLFTPPQTASTFQFNEVLAASHKRGLDPGGFQSET